MALPSTPGACSSVARVGEVDFKTALFPKDGVYLLPLKDAVRKASCIELDEMVAVGLSV